MLKIALIRFPLECVDFQRLSQNLFDPYSRRLVQREAEIRNLPWTETEKDNALTKCKHGLRAWHALSQRCHHVRPKSELGSEVAGGGELPTIQTKNQKKSIV